MSSGSFETILQRAQSELSPEERRQLIEALSELPDLESQSGNVPQTLYDALEARGIVGSITDAPDDLSTNPEHMEGFGEDA